MASFSLEVNQSWRLSAGEHLKHRFLVHDFASERIHETNVMVHVRANERMRIIIARQESWMITRL